MNGWLRLWVLVSVVWAVVVVSVAAIVIPEVAAPEVGSALSPKEAQKAVTDALTLYKENPDAPDAPELLARAERLNQYVLNYKPEKPALANRGRFYVQSLAWLAIPPLILLVLGYGFAWVLRGFGSNK
jgi:hypothetical protein